MPDVRSNVAIANGCRHVFAGTGVWTTDVMHRPQQPAPVLVLVPGLDGHGREHAPLGRVMLRISPRYGREGEDNGAHDMRCACDEFCCIRCRAADVKTIPEPDELGKFNQIGYAQRYLQ